MLNELKVHRPIEVRDENVNWCLTSGTNGTTSVVSNTKWVDLETLNLMNTNELLTIFALLSPNFEMSHLQPFHVYSLKVVPSPGHLSMLGLSRK